MKRLPLLLRIPIHDHEDIVNRIDCFDEQLLLWDDEDGILHVMRKLGYGTIHVLQKWKHLTLNVRQHFGGRHMLELAPPKGSLVHRVLLGVGLLPIFRWNPFAFESSSVRLARELGVRLFLLI